MKVITLIALALALCGCAATVKRNDTSKTMMVPADGLSRVAVQISSPHSASQDWELFKTEWRVAFRDQGVAAGVPVEFLDDRAKPSQGPGTLIAVNVLDYRYLSPGARYGFGVLTGNAYIESQISFTDLATGQPAGSKQYNTSSSAWEGIFSAMTDKQVQAIAASVFADLKAARSSSIGAVPSTLQNPITASARP